MQPESLPQEQPDAPPGAVPAQFVQAKEDSGQAGESMADKQVVQVDFLQVPLLTASQLRKLRLRHEDFARALATRLSIYLRLDFVVRLLGMETMRYSHVVQNLPSSSHLTLFHIEPLKGVGVVSLPPDFGISIVDRMCGGKGEAQQLERELTEVEVSLLDEAVLLLLQEWSLSVVQAPDCTCKVIGHENNPRFLHSSPGDTGMLMVRLEIVVGEQKSQLGLMLPFDLVEPLVEQLREPVEPKREKQPAKPLSWNPELNSMKIALSAQWDGIELTARQLVGLKVGDLLPMGATQLNRTNVLLERTNKFIGRVGKCGNAWAVEISQAVKS